MSPDQWVLLTILFMAVILLLGVPLVVTFGIGSILLMELTGTYSIQVLGQVPFGAIDQWALLAMPLFILTGDVVAKGGIAQELADLADKFLGWVRGGLGHTTLIACGFFAGISGSNAGDTAAIGRIMIPQLKRDNYDQAYAAALAASGGCVGIIIPPSIVFIVYGLVTSTSVAGLFLGGIFPGVLLVVSMCVANYFVSKKNNYGTSQGKRFSLKALIKAHWTSRHGLGAPLVILGGIYGGVFTPTEAAAVAVFYCFIAGLFFTRQLKLRDMPELLVRSGVLSGVIASLIAFAVLFGEVMGMLKIPARIAGFLLGFSSSPEITVLLILLLLMIAGCVLETIAIIVVLMPVLLPVGMALGFDPVHFGVWVVVALAIGFITPPVGVNLFVAAGLTGDPITSIARKAVPFVIAMALAELVIIHVPFLSTWYKLFATY
jgi:C4-dicarboxylate transporter, DctM subunit